VSISVDLPALDFSQPVEQPFLSTLSRACQEWGFFYVTNHGISKDLFDQVFALSRPIFSLPADSKLKIGPSSVLKTYTPHFIASPYFESLRVSGPDFLDSAKSSEAELFSEPQTRFSEVLQEYGNRMSELSKKIVKVLLMSLGDGYDRKFYESEFSNCSGYLRIVNYSPPEIFEEEEVEGLGMHTDMSCITIVYQDESGGLQMRSKDGEWLDIRPCENALVVNVGDLLQAWSNERLRSSEHRVVLRKTDEKLIWAPDEVVGQENSRVYQSFACLDYLKFRESNEHFNLCTLSRACQEWGFFYVTNHGIPKDLFSEVLALLRPIFSLPTDSKLKLGPSSVLKTYTSHSTAFPYVESLRVSGPDFLSSAKSSEKELFSEPNSRFSEVLQEYGNNMSELSKKIVKVLLMSLGDGYDKKFYESEFSNCRGYMRIINYSPPESLEEEVEGLGMHTDIGCITILYQDMNGGLQVRSREGQWLDIRPCENTLVVNVGDLFQAWSNERLRSSEHRVALRKTANRSSLAFFWHFEDGKVISAPDEIVGQENSRAYKPFVCLDYLKFRFRYEKIGHNVKDFAGQKLSEPIPETEASK
ncbi:hypothetical protein Tsubulata_015494, partial [Turnera subulata]